MHYKQRLEPWAVMRLLPNMQRITLARHRSPSNADHYCRALQRLEPQSKFCVVFDPIQEDRSHPREPDRRKTLSQLNES
ncbi:hypothetical protein ACKFKG_11380 [Phormidesmis sp. 146-35]